MAADAGLCLAELARDGSLPGVRPVIYDAQDFVLRQADAELLKQKLVRFVRHYRDDVMQLGSKINLIRHYLHVTRLRLLCQIGKVMPVVES